VDDHRLFQSQVRVVAPHEEAPPSDDSEGDESELDQFDESADGQSQSSDDEGDG
jgi:hypothetical protein